MAVNARCVDIDGVSVLDAAKARLNNLFLNTSYPVMLMLSGGKDSLCLHSLAINFVRSNPWATSRITVSFFDEEAVFPECRDLMLLLREQWLSLGVRFRWFALPVKHNNCFHQLEDTESWIVFDPACRDRWVQQPPPFAEMTNPMLEYPGQYNYQQAAKLIFPSHIHVLGVRINESYQRGNAYKSSVLANGGSQPIKPGHVYYPMWDWKDSDVWLYIKDNSLPYPRCYEKLFAMNGKVALRLSQVFSIDTAQTLARMPEYYPEFWERICIREPDAYLAALYYESEMFRKKSNRHDGQPDTFDYKGAVYSMLKNSSYAKGVAVRQISKLLVNYYQFLTDKDWCDTYLILTAGDPKCRRVRSLILRVKSRISEVGK